MSALAAIYWAGVLFALGISISMTQKIADDNPIVGLLLLVLFCGLALLSWVTAGILTGAILASILKRVEG